MTPAYRKGLKFSLMGHLVAFLILVISSLFNGCSIFRPDKKEPIQNIEFTVAIPEDMIAPGDDEEKAPEEEKKEEVAPAKDDIPPPAPENIVEPKKEEQKKEEPKKEEQKKEEPKKEENKKPDKKPFVKSDKIVVRGADRKKDNTKREIIPKPPKNVKTVKNPPGPKLTAAEIQKLLDMGAKPGETTIVPGERERCLLSIKDALYNAWIRPSASAATRRPAKIELTLGSSGAVLGRRLVSSSGNIEMDSSALSAANAIAVFNNLTPAFLREYKTVTIDFELE